MGSTPNSLKSLFAPIAVMVETTHQNTENRPFGCPTLVDTPTTQP